MAALTPVALFRLPSYRTRVSCQPVPPDVPLYIRYWMVSLVKSSGLDKSPGETARQSAIALSPAAATVGARSGVALSVRRVVWNTPSRRTPAITSVADMVRTKSSAVELLPAAGMSAVKVLFQTATALAAVPARARLLSGYVEASICVPSGKAPSVLSLKQAAVSMRFVLPMSDR